MMKTIHASLSALLAVVAFDAAAVTLYKSTDKDGLVTYSDQQPTSVGGRTVPLDIDTTANATPLPGAKSPQAESENERIIRRRPPAKDDSAVVLARQRLDAARAALEIAKDNSSPEDWIYFNPPTYPGMIPHPARRGPSPDYLARLESLEAKVKAAEITLADAERVVRLAP